MRGRYRHAATIGVATLILLSGSAASAQRGASPDPSRARDAFERGSAAYRLGDYGRAATEYARADALDPNPAALRAALDAATLADDPVLGEELIERAERMPGDAPGARALDAARARFAHRTGRVVIRCTPGAACLATVDGTAFDTSQPKIVTAGPHTVVVQTDGAPEPRIVSVAADAVVEIVARKPVPATAPAPTAASPAGAPPRPTPPEAKSGDLPPFVFFAALGATVVAGGFTTWSAFDTKSRHTTFENDCGALPAVDCGSLRSEGQSAQTRTNVLLAASGALAATTAALGLFVRWHGPRETALALTSSGGLGPGVGASLRVGF